MNPGLNEVSDSGEWVGYLVGLAQKIHDLSLEGWQLLSKMDCCKGKIHDASSMFDACASMILTCTNRTVAQKGRSSVTPLFIGNKNILKTAAGSGALPLCLTESGVQLSVAGCSRNRF